MSAAVTANGRIFYIVDEAPLASIRFLSTWKLVARDGSGRNELWSQPLGGEPVRWGIAVNAAGKIFVTLRSGEVLAFAEGTSSAK